MNQEASYTEFRPEQKIEKARCRVEELQNQWNADFKRAEQEIEEARRWIEGLLDQLK